MTNTLNATIKTVALLLFGFVIIACGNNINTLEDEKLGEIKLNQEFAHTINLDNAANGTAIETSVRINVSPADSGISADYQFKETAGKPENTVKIHGNPTTQGEIYVDVQWGIYGNMSYSPKLFKQRYVISVTE